MPGELELLLQALITPRGNQLPLLSLLLLLGFENLQKIVDTTSSAALSTADPNLCLGLAEVA